MLSIRTTLRGGLAFAILLTGLSFGPHITHADSVTVIPPKFELFGNPGDTLSDKIKVRNDGTDPIVYQSQVENFQASGDDGSIQLEGDGSDTKSFSMASWITVEPSKFTVAPGEETVVTFTIKIPKDGEPGGHYASVLIKRTGIATVGGAEVDSRVGSLLLLKVSGAVTETATLDSFKSKASFSQNGPVDFGIHFSNQGNVHVQPTGTIVITNMFGKKVAEFPFTPANVLPGASRQLAAEWTEAHPIGRFTATLVANYGTAKTTLTASTTFIVFPLSLLWLIIGLVAIVILLITQRKKFKRLINRLTSD